MEIKNSKKCTKNSTKNSEIKANTNNTNNTSKNSTKLNNSKNKLSLNDLTIKKAVKETKIDSNKPLVSVIVTICNTAHLLHSCIESIVEQTYTNLEIILIDTYSIDGSFKVCEKFASKDSRIKFTCDVFKSESDMRNYGLSQATGDYITFVSGSDFISLNYIEYQLEIIQKYNADISECEFIKVPEIVSAENSFEPPKQNVERITEFLPWQAIENLHSISHNTCVRTVVLWNKLYKAELLKNMKNLENPPRILDDMMFLLLVYLNTKTITFINDPLYYYMVRQDSIMGQIKKEQIESTEKAMVDIKHIYEQDEQGKKMLEVIDVMAFLHFGISLMFRMSSDKENFKQVLKDNREYLNKEFPKWRKSKYLNIIYSLKHKGANLKVAIVKKVYVLHLYKAFLAVYKWILKTFKIDIKW